MDFGDDYTEYSKDSQKNFFIDEVKPLLDDAENFDKAYSILKSEKDIYDKIDNMEDDEIAITCQNKYYDTFKKNTTSKDVDSNSFIIAVM